QSDKLKLKFEDRTFLNIVLQFARHEIKSLWTPKSPELDVIEKEIEPGDFMIVKIAASWTHGGVVIHWPDYVLHPIRDRGVIGSHGTREGFWAKRPRRFFTVLEPGQ